MFSPYVVHADARNIENAEISYGNNTQLRRIRSFSCFCLLFLAFKKINARRAQENSTIDQLHDLIEFD